MTRLMIIEVIEKFWKDKMGMPIYEWLGITQVTWCTQKKTKIAKKHMDKIFEYFDITDELTEYQQVRIITDMYYSL
jgi:hypothetical protein